MVVGVCMCVCVKGGRGGEGGNDYNMCPIIRFRALYFQGLGRPNRSVSAFDNRV